MTIKKKVVKKKEKSPLGEFKNASLVEVAKVMARVHSDLEKAKELTASIQNRFDFLRKVVVPMKMEELGSDNTVLKGIGRVTIRPEIYSGIVTGKEKEAYKWLGAHGFGSLIKETVNPSTLKAFLKEQVREGHKVPATLFKIEPYEMAVITETAKGGVVKKK